MSSDGQLWRICEQGLLAVGYELVEVEHLRDQHGWVLRIFIDHPGDEVDGEAPRGITHADCEMASRHLGAILDVEDPIETAYRLEVSSPGVRRPVRKQSDFERFVGRRARVQMRDPVEGQRNFTGRLLAAQNGTVTIEIAQGRTVALELSAVRRARLEEER